MGNRMQIRAFSIAEYIAAGCDQLRDAIGVGLHGYTQGRMCNGCPAFTRGCKAATSLNAPPPKQQFHSLGETVREEATRRGISIGEVRRQRNATGAAHEH